MTSISASRTSMMDGYKTTSTGATSSASGSYSITAYQDNVDYTEVNVDANIDTVEVTENVEKKSIGETLKDTGCTILVGCESVLAGIAKITEWLGDGITWLFGGLASLVTELFSHEAAEAIREATMDAIMVDQVGQMRKDFYEGTTVGRYINEHSNMKYNSKFANIIQNVTSAAVVIIVCTAAEILSAGTATPIIAAVGAGLIGAGKSAENRFSDTENRDFGKDSVWIAVDGVVEGVSSYFNAKAGASAVKGIKGILAATTKDSVAGAGKTLLAAIKNAPGKGVDGIKGIISASKNITAKQVASKLLGASKIVGKAGVKTIGQPDFWVDLAGSLSDNFEENIRDHGSDFSNWDWKGLLGEGALIFSANTLFNIPEAMQLAKAGGVADELDDLKLSDVDELDDIEAMYDDIYDAQIDSMADFEGGAYELDDLAAGADDALSATAGDAAKEMDDLVVDTSELDDIESMYDDIYDAQRIPEPDYLADNTYVSKAVIYEDLGKEGFIDHYIKDVGLSDDTSKMLLDYIEGDVNYTVSKDIDFNSNNFKEYKKMMEAKSPKYKRFSESDWVSYIKSNPDDFNSIVAKNKYITYAEMLEETKARAAEGYFDPKYSVDDIIEAKVKFRQYNEGKLDPDEAKIWADKLKTINKNHDNIPNGEYLPGCDYFISDKRELEYLKELLPDNAKIQNASTLEEAAKVLAESDELITIDVVTFQTATVGANNIEAFGSLGHGDIQAGGPFCVPVSALDEYVKKYPDLCEFVGGEFRIKKGKFAEFGNEVLSGVPLAEDGAFLITSTVPVNGDSLRMPCVGNTSSYGDFFVEGGQLLSGNTEVTILPITKIPKGKKILGTHPIVGDFEELDWTELIKQQESANLGHNFANRIKYIVTKLVY